MFRLKEIFVLNYLKAKIRIFYISNKGHTSNIWLSVSVPAIVRFYFLNVFLFIYITYITKI